jgi:diketogulonate reductase-like aldo/keto reductase
LQCGRWKWVDQNIVFSKVGIFDFELTDEEVAQINALDKNHRFGYDPVMV